jgi:hypothetical protein
MNDQERIQLVTDYIKAITSVSGKALDSISNVKLTWYDVSLGDKVLILPCLEVDFRVIR